MMRRTVTFRGAAKVMPRSMHSSMEYLIFSSTGSPQEEQRV